MLGRIFHILSLTPPISNFIAPPLLFYTWWQSYRACSYLHMTPGPFPNTKMADKSTQRVIGVFWKAIPSLGCWQEQRYTWKWQWPTPVCAQKPKLNLSSLTFPLTGFQRSLHRPPTWRVTWQSGTLRKRSSIIHQLQCKWIAFANFATYDHANTLASPSRALKGADANERPWRLSGIDVVVKESSLPHRRERVIALNTTDRVWYTSTRMEVGVLSGQAGKQGVPHAWSREGQRFHQRRPAEEVQLLTLEQVPCSLGSSGETISCC